MLLLKKRKITTKVATFIISFSLPISSFVVFFYSVQHLNDSLWILKGNNFFCLDKSRICFSLFVICKFVQEEFDGNFVFDFFSKVVSLILLPFIHHFSCSLSLVSIYSISLTLCLTISLLNLFKPINARANFKCEPNQTRLLLWKRKIQK